LKRKNKMNLQFYLEKLQSSKEFKKFSKENPNAYLCSGFFIVDKANVKNPDNKVHLDFYIPAGGKVFSFDVKEEQKGLFDTNEPDLPSEKIQEEPKQTKKTKKPIKSTQPSPDEELPFGITQTTTAFINGRPVRIIKSLVMTPNGLKWKITNPETNETWFEDQ